MSQKFRGYSIIKLTADALPYVELNGHRFRLADEFSVRNGDIGKFTAHLTDVFAEEVCPQMDLHDAIFILGRSPRGQRTLETMQTFMDTTGLGLDQAGRHALESLLLSYWDQPATTSELVNATLKTKLMSA